MEDALSLPLYKSSYDRLFRDYSYAAAINYGDLSKQEQVINWCKEAIKAANEYGYNIGSQWTTTLLGNIYYRTGRVNDALELYMESAKISNDSGDKKGEANAYNSLINLYIEWGMFEEANELANISLNNIISSAGNDFYLMGKSLYSKGLSVFKLGLLDSTLYFWEKADKYFTSLPYEEGLIDLDNKYV